MPKQGELAPPFLNFVGTNWEAYYEEQSQNEKSTAGICHHNGNVSSYVFMHHTKRLRVEVG
ncbi:hypothetical protein NUITMVS3_13970 [Shewanella xiamenensis]|nr:hypothetical protein NUITMVS2_25840 [Shewanella xiamenensis]GLD76966.1 hypothetical protein NUITMVS3_13970 [Shewanella xiamenensis]